MFFELSVLPLCLCGENNLAVRKNDAMRLNEKDYTYFTTVRGLCRRCRQIVPARVFFRQEQVWQQSLCPSPACGKAMPTLIATDQNWFLLAVLKPMPDHSPLPGSREPVRGCPHDCGPCAFHASPCQRTQNPGDTVSVNSPRPEEDKELRQTLDTLTAAGVRITLQTVLTRDTNEHTIGNLWAFMRPHKNILGLTVQTTGHIPVDQAARIVCEQTDGELTFTDFAPSLAAHPLCYLIAESAGRTITIHSHMNEDSFDCSRAMMCPDMVPAGPGRLIPACTYNLFHRQQHERFHVE